jgi:Mg-chelatase subunit ChlD
MPNVVISPEDRLRVIEDVSITVLLDASGSMYGVEKATRDSANRYVEELNTGAPVTLSLATFSDDVKWVVSEIPSDAVRPLTKTHYRADGDTKLYDSIGEAIERIDAMDVPPVHPVVVVFTDGHDNVSVRFDAEQIKDLIRQRRACGWRFIAFVSGSNAVQATARAGFLATDTSEYAANDKSTQVAFELLAASTKRLVTAVVKKALPPARFLG